MAAIDRRTAVEAASIALLVGVGAGLAPMMTLIVVCAALAVGMALFAPRLTVGVAVLAVLLVRPLEQLTGHAASYLDEAAVVLCALTMPLRRLANRKTLRTFPGQWWFTAFLVIGLLSGLLLEVPLGLSLSGAFVTGKGLLLAWAVAQVDWSERHLLAAARLGTAVVLLSLAAMAVNLGAPEAWNAVLASDPNAVEPRSILPSVIGPFTHPIDLGQFMVLSAVAIAAWRAAVRKGPFTLGLLVATVAGAVLTARRTASASVAAAWLCVQTMARATRVLVVLAAALPLAVVLLAGPATQVVRATYQDYFGQSTPEARTVLTLDSFAVAADHFPAGAGFGRFGSAIAASNYSPEYVQRGYPNIWGLGLTAENGRFLTDTEWPAIIGETGFFGAAAFALGLVALFRAGRRLWWSARRPVQRWAGLTLMGWLVALLVQSIGTVSFTGPPVQGAFFALVGVVTAVLDRGAPAMTPPDPRASRVDREEQERGQQDEVLPRRPPRSR